MSLRRRLFALLFVSCVALTAFALAITRMISVGAAAREADATAAGERAMQVVAERLHAGIGPRSPAAAALLDDLAHTLADGTVGICTTAGEVVATRTSLVDSETRRMPGEEMLPFDAERVETACRAADATAHTRRELAPDDVLSIATMRTSRGSDLVAFALSRVPRSHDERTSPSVPFLALAGLTTMILLALTAHGAWVLRTSTSSLETSLEALSRDLRTPIAEPRARELATVATHLRELATTLADAQERERALNRDVAEQKRLAGLGRVVAGVAHEVRNPLAGMKLRLESMSLRSLDARTRVDVDKCLNEVERLDRLVRTLLLASRKRAPERTSFGAGAMVDERLALMQPVASAAHVQLDREGDATLVGEREELAGVIDNLVRNAIEASSGSEENDARVLVRIRANDDGSATLDVVNDGPGVPSERETELFEPFFTTKGTGTGLGLSLARAAIEAHGGTLRYERRDGKTVFLIALPPSSSSGERS